MKVKGVLWEMWIRLREVIGDKREKWLGFLGLVGKKSEKREEGSEFMKS